MEKELAEYHKEMLNQLITSLNNGISSLKTVNLTPEMVRYLEENGVSVKQTISMIFKLTLKTKTK